MNKYGLFMLITVKKRLIYNTLKEEKYVFKLKLNDEQWLFEQVFGKKSNVADLRCLNPPHTLVLFHWILREL